MEVDKPPLVELEALAVAVEAIKMELLVLALQDKDLQAVLVDWAQ
jgi:ribosomal protein L12E/L44/L45/RPP1/RPP2